MAGAFSASEARHAGGARHARNPRGRGAGPAEPRVKKPGFEVRLANFTGPFDLLLGLISKHQLDITEVALSTVTDEFIKYIKGLQQLGEEWALDEASEFLVIAATLLDLKAARLLPAGEVEDDEDIALLEARDLLFARLLQYKAFKQVAGMMGSTLELEARRYPAAGRAGGALRCPASGTALAAHPAAVRRPGRGGAQAQGSRPHRSRPRAPARHARQRQGTGRAAGPPAAAGHAADASGR